MIVSVHSRDENLPPKDFLFFLFVILRFLFEDLKIDERSSATVSQETILCVNLNGSNAPILIRDSVNVTRFPRIESNVFVCIRDLFLHLFQLMRTLSFTLYRASMISILDSFSFKAYVLKCIHQISLLSYLDLSRGAFVLCLNTTRAVSSYQLCL